MKKSFLAALACLAVSALTAKAQLIAGWDFQTTTNNGTAVAASPNTPTVFVANVGTGTLYLNGTNGSSTWNATTELNGFGGTALNATNGLSTTTTSPASLALLGGTGNATNGKSIVFSFSTTGITDPISISYATQRTNTGYNSQLWEYSLNATDWFTLQTNTSIPASFAVVTLTSTTALSNQATAYVRFTGTGASSASGNNRLDNIQIAAVPEPGTVALVGLGLGAILFGLRRRTA